MIHSADDSMIPVEMSFDRYYEKFSDNDRFTFARYEDRGHNYVFYDESIRQYHEAFNEAGKQYTDSVGEVTPEMRLAYFAEHFDKHQAYVLDEALMQQMLDLYDSSI